MPSPRKVKEDKIFLKPYWNKGKSKLIFLLVRLSFSRFSLTIKTLATDVYLGEEKKALSLFFLLLLWQ